MAWDEVASLLALAAPIVAVPLGVITFYLRSLREQHVVARDGLTRRIDGLESDLQRIELRLQDHERDFTAKEDWLRESMLARQTMERLSDACARLEAQVEKGHACPRAAGCEGTGAPGRVIRPPTPQREAQ